MLEKLIRLISNYKLITQKGKEWWSVNSGNLLHRKTIKPTVQARENDFNKWPQILYILLCVHVSSLVRRWELDQQVTILIN